MDIGEGRKNDEVVIIIAHLEEFEGGRYHPIHRNFLFRWVAVSVPTESVQEYIHPSSASIPQVIRVHLNVASGQAGYSFAAAHAVCRCRGKHKQNGSNIIHLAACQSPHIYDTSTKFKTITAQFGQV